MASDIRRGDALAGMVRFLAATTSQELVITTMADRRWRPSSRPNWPSN